jgi:hypothetical protein
VVQATCHKIVMKYGRMDPHKFHQVHLKWMISKINMPDSGICEKLLMRDIVPSENKNLFYGCY